MEEKAFEVKIPSVGKRLYFEYVPTEPGEILSLFKIRNRKIIKANKFERMLGLTFKLTNVISELIKTAKEINKTAIVEIVGERGFIKQEIELNITSSSFSISVEKKFNGGTEEDDVMNYLVCIYLQCMFKEHADLIESNLNNKCPKPLTRKEY